MDLKYVPGNADNVIFLCDCRKNSNPIERDKLYIRNSCDPADAFKTK